jgi:Domain of unknown function (DUF5615)
MLDAHVSGPRVGRSLAEMGHDVRAVDQEKELERLPDEQLFELAVSDGRILVTHNVGDFLRILIERPLEKSHAGLVLIPRSIKLDDFGAIISGIREMVSEHSQEEWVDRVEWMKRAKTY